MLERRKRKTFEKSPSHKVHPTAYQSKQLPLRFDSGAILETMPNYVIKSLNSDVVKSYET